MKYAEPPFRVQRMGAAVTPNDPGYTTTDSQGPLQWYLPKIGAAMAWAGVTDARDVPICVLGAPQRSAAQRSVAGRGSEGC